MQLQLINVDDFCVITFSHLYRQLVSSSREPKRVNDYIFTIAPVLFLFMVVNAFVRASRVYFNLWPVTQ